MNDQHYRVVVNAEEQYSIWAEHLPIPKGWVDVHAPAPKDICLKYIESVWTDMRPKSVRTSLGN